MMLFKNSCFLSVELKIIYEQFLIFRKRLFKNKKLKRIKHLLFSKIVFSVKMTSVFNITYHSTSSKGKSTMMNVCLMFIYIGMCLEIMKDVF